ncbi:MAG: hypothetical protein IT432_15250 [Phycisphaerales bacterium]|nr:hypothetical protein [Phycisphaerales bacterium]
MNALILLTAFPVLLSLAACNPMDSKPPFAQYGPAAGIGWALLKNQQGRTRSDIASPTAYDVRDITPRARDLLVRAEALGFPIEVSSYAAMPSEVLESDLQDVVGEIESFGAPSRAVVEEWDIAPRSEIKAARPPLDPEPKTRLSAIPYGGAVVRFVEKSSLPIVLLPKFGDACDMQYSRLSERYQKLLARESKGAAGVFELAKAWSAAVYFKPWNDADLYGSGLAMPSRDPRFQYQEFGLTEGPPQGKIGKLLYCPDLSTSTNDSFFETVLEIRDHVPDDTIGVVMTAEITPSLWGFTATPPKGCVGATKVFGFAVPLLDGNGSMRGDRIDAVTPERGSPFENLIEDVPAGLRWGRHPLHKLPHPVGTAVKNAEERIVALIPADQSFLGPVQAFRKAKSWGPFAEDVVFDPTPNASMFSEGEVRALAVSASIGREELRRLLGAMTGRPVTPEPGAPRVNGSR